jgi:hypothetical protein
MHREHQDPGLESSSNSATKNRYRKPASPKKPNTSQRSECAGPLSAREMMNAPDQDRRKNVQRRMTLKRGIPEIRNFMQRMRVSIPLTMIIPAWITCPI